MRVPFRQGLVSYQRAGAVPTFLQVSSTDSQFISHVVEPTPTVATFANGGSDYLQVFDVTTDLAWGPIGPGTTYLYWEIDRFTGQVSRGMTTLEPIVSPVAPLSPQNGQMWFDLATTKMKYWRAASSAWIEVIRLLAGSVTAGNITHQTEGSQVGLAVMVSAGYVVFDSALNPIRKSNGEFLTSTDASYVKSTADTAGTLVQPLNNISVVKSGESIPKMSLVYFSAEDTVRLASSNPALSPERVPVGMVLDDLVVGDLGVLVTGGEVSYDQWDWSASIGAPVYSDTAGQITTVRPAGLQAHRVGFVKNATTIIFNIDTETTPQVYNTNVNQLLVVGTVPVQVDDDLSPLGERVITISVDEATTSTPGLMSAASLQTLQGFDNRILAVEQDIIDLDASKADVVHTHSISQVTGLQTALDARALVTHTHVAADITDLQALLDGKANVVHAHTIADVTGLQSALDGKASVTHTHAIADVTGLQAALDGKANTVHAHAIADVTGLQAALDGRALIVHQHTISQVTGLQTTLDSKASISHTHVIGDVVGLTDALLAKANVVHTHAIADVTGLQTALDDKAAVSHAHAIADVTGLQTALDGKAAVSHTHVAADITDFAAGVNSRLAPGTNVTLDYNPGTGITTINSTGGGGGGSYTAGNLISVTDLSSDIISVEHIEIDDTGTAENIRIGPVSTTPTGDNNVLIGHGTSAALTTGSQNVSVGNLAGSAITDGYGNVMIGHGAGTGAASAQDNIFIGKWAGREQATAETGTISNRLVINNETARDPSIYAPFIEGDMSVPDSWMAIAAELRTRGVAGTTFLRLFENTIGAEQQIIIGTDDANSTTDSSGISIKTGDVYGGANFSGDVEIGTGSIFNPEETGTAGSVYIFGGNGYADGGDIELTGGSSSESTVDGANVRAGNILVRGGSSTAANAGSIQLLAGASSANGGAELSLGGGYSEFIEGGGDTGGPVLLQAGYGRTGGSVTIQSGTSANPTTNGGALRIETGSGPINGGELSIVTGSGGDAGGELILSTAVGGNTGGQITVSAGSGTVAGGGISFSAGTSDGGDAVGAEVSLEGAYSHAPGLFTGGGIDLTAGDADDGGSISLTGGSAQPSGTAGAVTIVGGAGGAQGGTVLIAGGAGDTGGLISLLAGDSTAADGAAITLVAGAGSSNGGSISLTGGVSTAALGTAGGAITLTGGAGDADTDGGAVTIWGGSASGAGTGGDTIIRGGLSSTGTAGSVLIYTDSWLRLGIDPTGAWLINGMPGTAGQVFTSQGAGAPPTWTTVSSGGGDNTVLSTYTVYTQDPDILQLYNFTQTDPVNPLRNEIDNSFLSIAGGYTIQQLPGAVQYNTSLSVLDAATFEVTFPLAPAAAAYTVEFAVAITTSLGRIMTMNAGEAYELVIEAGPGSDSSVYELSFVADGTVITAATTELERDTMHRITVQLDTALDTFMIFLDGDPLVNTQTGLVFASTISTPVTWVTQSGIAGVTHVDAPEGMFLDNYRLTDRALYTGSVYDAGIVFIDDVSSTSSSQVTDAVTFDTMMRAQVISGSGTTGDPTHLLISAPDRLVELADVRTRTAADGQVLKFDNRNSIWYAGDLRFSELTDISVNSAVTGDVLTFDGTSWRASFIPPTPPFVSVFGTHSIAGPTSAFTEIPVGVVRAVPLGEALVYDDGSGELSSVGVTFTAPSGPSDTGECYVDLPINGYFQLHLRMDVRITNTETSGETLKFARVYAYDGTGRRLGNVDVVDTVNDRTDKTAMFGGTGDEYFTTVNLVMNVLAAGNDPTGNDRVFFRIYSLLSAATGTVTLDVNEVRLSVKLLAVGNAPELV